MAMPVILYNRLMAMTGSGAERPFLFDLDTDHVGPILGQARWGVC